jgi:hypothetical protein
VCSKINTKGCQSISSCECIDGYYGINGICSKCSINKWSSFGSAKNSTECNSCPLNSISLEGSTINGCQCIPGYTGPNGGICTPCPKGVCVCVCFVRCFFILSLFTFHFSPLPILSYPTLSYPILKLTRPLSYHHII